MSPLKNYGRLRRSLGILPWAVAGYITLLLFLVLVARLRIRPVIDAVRAFNKRMLNPVMLKVAGRRHWYAAVIHHTGRRSGKTYATPIVAEPTGDGFVIPLPYGESVDWLRNVLAAEQATIEAKGSTYPVDQPVVVDRSIVEPLLPPRMRRLFQLYGIDTYLKVHTLPSSTKLDPDLPVKNDVREPTVQI